MVAMEQRPFCTWTRACSFMIAVGVFTCCRPATGEGALATWSEQHGTPEAPLLSTERWSMSSHAPAEFTDSGMGGSISPSKRADGLLDYGRGRSLAEVGSEGISSCPISFHDLPRVKFAIADTCKTFEAPTNDTWPPVGRFPCCNVINTAFAMASAQWTTVSQIFRVQNASVLRSCVKDMASAVRDMGITVDVESCFTESYYRYSQQEPALCGPITTADFEGEVDSSSLALLRYECNGDLLDSQTCQVCSAHARAIFSSVADIAISKNKALELNDSNVSSVDAAKSYDCIYVTVTYIAGIQHAKGPFDPGAAKCLYIMPLPPSNQSHFNHLALGLGLGLGLGMVAIVACLFFIWSRRTKCLSVWHIRSSSNSENSKSVLHPSRGGVVLFDYQDLVSATEDFAEKNLIGSGGFGSVFKGLLEDGTVIAVKRLKNCNTDGEAEFVNEVEMINRVRHRNLVRLRGCCVSGGNSDVGLQRFLVYEFMPNGSLHDHLFIKKRSGLSWPERSRIAIDIARGLCYLHNDTQPPIFHRDIKASNVLLDKNFSACLADFGLARLTQEGQSHMTASTVAGTHGYMAPEYAMYGKLTDKSDVYSFGVVLLEIVSGRKALDPSQIATPRFLITDWCWNVFEMEGSVTGVIDERIRDGSNLDVLAVQERFVIAGMLCSHSHDAMRPTMTDALKYLEGDLSVPFLPQTPPPLYAETSTYKKWLGDSTSGTTSSTYSTVLSMNITEPR